MKFKKIINIVTFCMICSACSMAAAQEPISIPEDYQAATAQTELQKSGPKLIFSDSPEMVNATGILYRDTVQGDVRIFFHHVNNIGGKKKLAVLLTNTDNLRPAHYKMLRNGIGGYHYDYMRDGKQALQKYFNDDTQVPYEGNLGFSRSVELLSGKGVILPYGRLVTGIIDLHLDKPLQVTVLMCEPQQDIELFNEDAAVLPMDEHPLRGTFDNSDWNYKVLQPISADTAVMLKLADNENEGYLKGIDVPDNKSVENYGNYGVIYHVHFTVVGEKPVSFIISPIGGPFAGYGVLENKTTKTRQLIALPEHDVAFGNKVDDAVKITELTAGEYNFIWSPPGASNLPIRLLWQGQNK